MKTVCLDLKRWCLCLCLQAQLAAEQGRSSALEKKLSSLPQPSSSASVAAPPAKTAAPLSESILSPKVETRGGKAPAASEPIASAKAPSAEEPAASSQPEAGGTVPVVIMACCRPSYLEKTLVTLTNRLPKDGRFKLVVSQDGTHEGVASLMKDKFPSVRFMQHVDDSPIVKKSGAWELDSYYKIARHYGWALGKVILSTQRLPLISTPYAKQAAPCMAPLQGGEVVRSSDSGVASCRFSTTHWFSGQSCWRMT